jgi:hypothetical protein
MPKFRTLVCAVTAGVLMAAMPLVAQYKMTVNGDR